MSNKPKLTAADYANAAKRLAVDTAAIEAVAAVESAGQGFDSSDRPIILFERHKFSHFTNGRFDKSHPGISNRTPGGYGKSSEQYARFDEAFTLDSNAAMMATSWGKFQILGANFAHCGFATVGDFVNAQHESEAAQLDAFCNFILFNHLDDELRNHEWAHFARGYNGGNYRINHYDTKLAAAYNKFVRHPLHLIESNSIDAQSNQPTQTTAATAKSANAEEHQSENINPLDSAANNQSENQTPPPTVATNGSDNETASNSQISSEQSSVGTNTESKAAQILPGNVSLESSQTKGQQPQIAENINNIAPQNSDADKIKAAQNSEDTVAEAHTHTGFLGKAGAIVAGIATGTYTIPAFAQSDTFLNGLFTGLEGLFHGLFVMRYILIGSLSLWFVIHKIESITIRLAAIKINSDPTLANVSIVQTPRKGLYTRIHEYLFGV